MDAGKPVQIAGIPVAADQYIRLQCVQLVHRPDKDEQTIIDRAEKLASYVISGTAKPTPRGASVRQGKRLTPD